MSGSVRQCQAGRYECDRELDNTHAGIYVFLDKQDNSVFKPLLVATAKKTIAIDGPDHTHYAASVKVTLKVIPQPSDQMSFSFLPTFVSPNQQVLNDADQIHGLRIAQYVTYPEESGSTSGTHSRPGVQTLSQYRTVVKTLIESMTDPQTHQHYSIPRGSDPLDWAYTKGIFPNPTRPETQEWPKK